MILKKYDSNELKGTNELTEQQIYTRWSELNAKVWRLHDDEVKSAQEVLKQADGTDIEMIPITSEEGRSSFAYALKDVLAAWADNTVELCVDSTC